MLIKKVISVLAMSTLILFTGCDKDDEATLETGQKVISFSPGNNATNVGLNKVISVNFSEDMDAETINSSTFTLMQGSNVIAGTVEYWGLTATFKPTATLSEGTNYTVNLTTSVKNAAGVAISKDVSWKFTTGTALTAGLAPIDLGAAGNYVILAKTAINNSPTSAITGDIALSPAATSYITGLSLVDNIGFATSSQITGKAFAADMVAPTSSNLTTAVNNMITAYNDAAGRLLPDFTELGSGNIGGKTLVPGLYKWTSTVTAPTNFVISGSSTDVWIFQISGDLTVSSGVNITLGGGAKPENIFWQVAGEVTLGTTSNFKGIILSKTGITLNTAAVFTGRALAQTSVILDKNTVMKP